jgi:sulfur carrier protein ThiS
VRERQKLEGLMGQPELRALLLQADPRYHDMVARSGIEEPQLVVERGLIVVPTDWLDRESRTFSALVMPYLENAATAAKSVSGLPIC